MIISNFKPLSQLFRFSARLAESLGSLAGIYFLVRGLDKPGSGNISITLQQASEYLERSPSTIRAYIHKALRNGVFQRVQNDGNGKYHIHYTSDVKLCVSLGIGLGAIARAPMNRVSNLKFLAAEATAEAIQKKSLHHAAKQISKTNSDKRIPDLDKIFTQVIGSEKSAGRGYLGMGTRCLYLDSSFVSVGGKQETIADSLDRCRATVNRRLSNTYRLNRHLPLLQKRQLAIASEMPTRALPILRDEALMSGNLDEFNFAQRHFPKNVNGHLNLFQAHTNIYNCSDIELTRQKHKRSRLSRAFALKKQKSSETAGTSES